jgi:hypothetical protein
VLNDGRVLIVGERCDTVTTSAEFYDLRLSVLAKAEIQVVDNRRYSAPVNELSTPCRFLSVAALD